jgi:hypothetical protein
VRFHESRVDLVLGKYDTSNAGYCENLQALRLRSSEAKQQISKNSQLKYYTDA